ncbi:MAG: V-type ATP synthase subunit I [Halobacteriaceae archaeon]
MLRPSKMSKVSVTGTKAVMPDVIEAAHETNLLHLSDYGGEYEGFDNGSPVEGADEASQKLVTVRSLQSILDVSEEDAGPTRIVTEEALAEDLEEVRRAANDLDDRRDEIADELRSVEERIDALDPFVSLGIDLDYLRGYDSLDVAVGEADPEAVEDALAHASDVAASEVFSGDGVVAAFARPAENAESPLDEALVNVDFTRLDVPDEEGSPSDIVAELEHERETLESRLESVESELDDLRLEHAGFLLAAEETLTIEVQKHEAPLSFATTEHAFVAEGWVPSEEYTDFVETIRDAVGDSVEIEELERATYTPSHGHSHEAGEDAEAVADGGHPDPVDEPPVVQDNPKPAKPFELLVRMVSRPSYSELDPTILLLLTFPAFYGFMIGDLGYGLLYFAGGFLLWSRLDSDAFRSLGGVAMWAGGFTALFGILYGEIFGLHLISTHFWEGALNMHGPPIEKGLHTRDIATKWLAVSLVVGLIHLGIGYVFGFVNDWRAHGLVEAVMEDASKLMLMGGVGVWLFSAHLQSGGGPRPPFLLNLIEFPATVGVAALVVAAVGLVLLTKAEGAAGFFESPTYALVNTVSYTRIAAVLLAKAGMAFVVNLLVFGAYEYHGEVHFMLSHGPSYVKGHYGAEAIMFPGLVNAGVAGIVGGLVILVLGHALVLALGVTSAGLQAVRLEYVEFFGKFYEGGGTEYDPFGHARTYTTEE